MLTPRIRAALVALTASAGLAACTSYGPYGGSGVGVSVGYGSPYGYGGYSPYGYGYGYGGPYGYMPAYWTGHNSYFGWYDGFYYPGAGYYCYDSFGRRFRLSDRQTRYWSDQLRKYREQRGATAEVRENFAGFRSKAKAGATIAGVDVDAHARANERALRQISETRRQAQAEHQVQQRVERQQVRTERQQARSERQESIRAAVIERREQRRTSRGKTDD